MNFFKNRETGEQSVIAVNVTSIRDEGLCDESCLLYEGDHSFNKHPSYVYYRGAAIFRLSRIANGIASGEITVLENLSMEVLSRVMEGFERSPFTPAKILKALRNCATASDEVA